MGFWRGFGYFINIIWIIAAFIVPYGIFSVWIPILFLYVLRKGAKNEAMRKDIHDIASMERQKEKRQQIEDAKEQMKNLEDWK